jgi:hypothetical protein
MDLAASAVMFSIFSLLRPKLQSFKIGAKPERPMGVFFPLETTVQPFFFGLARVHFKWPGPRGETSYDP